VVEILGGLGRIWIFGRILDNPVNELPDPNIPSGGGNVYPCSRILITYLILHRKTPKQSVKKQEIEIQSERIIKQYNDRQKKRSTLIPNNFLALISFLKLH